MEERRGESLEVNEHNTTEDEDEDELASTRERERGNQRYLLCCFASLLFSENFHRNERGWSAPQWREEDSTTGPSKQNGEDLFLWERGLFVLKQVWV